MKVWKIEKKTQTKIEQIKMFVSILCVINSIHLPEVELNALAYYIHYGISQATDDLLIKSKVVKDINALRNIKYRLTKKGFLKRDKMEYRSYSLNGSDLYFKDNDIRLIIKLDNS